MSPVPCMMAADAVMLSAESASGAYPVQADSIMDRIINEVESDPFYPKMINVQHDVSLPSKSDAICSCTESGSEMSGA